MNAGTVSSAVVLEVFRLLFTTPWVVRWQRQWQRQQRREQGLGPRVRRRRGSPAPPKPARKPPAQGAFYQRIFSLRVTLWYLIFQRLNFDHTAAGVVVNVRAGGADRLGRRGCAQLSRRVRSAKTNSYHEARQRLPLELLQAALGHLGGVLLKLAGLAAFPGQRPGPAQRPRQILDGSTLAMLTNPLLAAAYPPSRNQTGLSDWSLMHIVVGFCARTGAVLSAVEGSRFQSEQMLAWSLMAVAAKFTIWIGDRNFGVWSVVAQAVQHRQDVVVRLTKSRAAKLAGGQPLVSGEDRLIDWAPSRYDQAPPGVERKAVRGRLLYVRLQKQGQWIDLWLFTTLDAQDYPLALLVTWYGQRWQAELHFRSVKTHLQMAELEVASPAMARKEFYAGLLAYNLVRAVMWSAGQRLEGGIKTISFSQARRVILEHLRNWGSRGLSDAQWAKRVVAEVARQTLPKRAKERPSEVRRQRHRRQHFPPLQGSRAAARAREAAIKSG